MGKRSTLYKDLIGVLVPADSDVVESVLDFDRRLGEYANSVELYASDQVVALYRGIARRLLTSGVLEAAPWSGATSPGSSCVRPFGLRCRATGHRGACLGFRLTDERAAEGYIGDMRLGVRLGPGVGVDRREPSPEGQPVQREHAACAGLPGHRR